LGIQPLGMARLRLPHRKEPIHVVVQQEDDGITKGCVRIAERSADPAVSCCMGPAMPLSKSTKVAELLINC
jgi:hypothetical protein